jgi:protein-tyrosine sulfotransferase
MARVSGMFPQAQFVCFYRACPPMVSAATQVSRWGLASTGLGDFASKYPGNNVAAVAAYWCASTTALLDFEAAQPGRSLRVRQEDLTASPAATTSSILDFLSLTGYRADLPEPPAEGLDAPTSAGQSGAAAEQQIPLELLPAMMLDRINSLHARLGYPALTRDPQPAELADHTAR